MRAPKRFSRKPPNELFDAVVASPFDGSAVRRAIAHGIDPSWKAPRSGETVTHAAARLGAEQVRAVLLAGAPVDAGDAWRRTPLMISLEQGRDPDVPLLLLKAGADAEKTDSYGDNVFHYLASNAKLRSFALLVSALAAAGADGKAVNADGELPEEQGGPEFAELVSFFCGAKKDELPQESFFRGSKVLSTEALLREIEDDRSWGKNKRAAFDIVVYERIKSLVEKGADVNATSARGWNLLSRLVDFGAAHRVEWALYGAKADPNSPHPKRGTVLHAAVSSKRTEAPAIVAFLLDKGADPTVLDAQKKTPLDVASDSTVIRLLVNALRRKIDQVDRRKLELPSE